MNQIDERTSTGLVETDTGDDDALRIIVVVPWELPRWWEQWQPLFASGPMPIAGGVGRIVFDGVFRQLCESVRGRMLSTEHRSHYVYEGPSPVFVGGKNRTSHGTAPLRISAWDIFRVEAVNGSSDSSAGSCDSPPTRKMVTEVLIAAHPVLRDPLSLQAFSWVRNLTQEPKGRKEPVYEANRVLSLLSGHGLDEVSHGSGAVNVDDHEGVNPYAIAYVPYDVIASEREKGFELDDSDVHAEQEKAVGRQFRGLKRSVIESGSSMARRRTIVSSWWWGHLPRRIDETLQDGLFEQHAQQFHRPLQTWVTYAGSHGCSFCQVQQGEFFPLAQIEGRFTEASLLMLLQHYRAFPLMARLTDVQPRAADEADRVIKLDSEAVRFVVFEQWTTMTDTDRQLGAFLAYLLDTHRIPLLVEEVRDQAHRLRENVLMCIGRADQKAEEERARSTRVMEITLAVLTFIGLPLSVFLEIWSDQEVAKGITARHQHIGGWDTGWGWTFGFDLFGSPLIGGGTWLLIDKVGGRVARRGKRS